MKLSLSTIEVNTFKNAFRKFAKVVDKVIPDSAAKRDFDKDFNRLKQKGTIKNKVSSITMDKDGNVDITVNTNFVTGFTTVYFKTSEKLIKPIVDLGDALKEQHTEMDKFVNKWFPTKNKQSN